MKRSLAISAFVLILGISATALYAQSKLTRRPQSQITVPESSQTVTPTPTPQAQLSVMSGLAEVKRNDAIHTVDATASEPVADGDMITTKPQAVATITYDEGMVLRLGPDSSMTFENQEKVLHHLGSFYVRFKKILGVRESFTVETTTAIASVRGSAFASFVDKTGATKIVVTKDQAFVKPNNENTEEQTVDEQKMAVIDAKKHLSLSPWKLTDKEKAWVDVNTKADELGVFPSVTPTPSATPKPKAPSISSMPGEGLTRSTVTTDVGDFPLTCYGANTGSISVITDSASDADCTDNCPVKSLAEFAASNNAVAAMNGMYFCPSEYPSCSDRKNSFDTLFFISRLKTYLNSPNNVYSTLPWLAVEGNGHPLFYSQTLQWGRDTGIQAGTSGNPLLVKDGAQVATDAGLDEKQKTAKGPRGAIAQKGDVLYLCTVGSATVLDSAKVYATLGADNAMNIDGGGSTALWANGGYIFGPGRNIPTAIIFKRK